jgi:N-acetylmuramoyl-L-alanine amidase
MKSSKRKNFRHNWENTIKKFLRVTKGEGDPKAVDATFMIGELYRMLYGYSSIKGDLKKSIEYYEKVADSFPSSYLADDAIYKVGRIYEEKLKNNKKAYNAYLRVTEEFPLGDMVSKARSKMIRLKKHAPKAPKKAAPVPAVASDRTMVHDIKYWSGKDSTRIAIYPQKSIDYKYNFLGDNKKTKAPPRLYIDLYNTKLARDIPRLVEIKDGMLKAIRSDQHDSDIVRVVLDIQNIDSYRVFTFENPFRIVIDVSGEGSDVVVAKKPKVEVTAPKINTKSDNAKYTLAKQLGLGVKKIVIDPGHGGRDPGAIGLNKIREKDVTLKISKKLKAIIEENLEDVEVILTRDKDKTVSLEARTAIAKKEKADIFISVHTNASDKHNVRGVETYFLNYATNEHAMKTAARENATSKLALSDLEGIVKIIRYSNVQESRELARKVQKAIYGNLRKSYKGTRNLGVKQAPFYVLFGSQKPSILIETSFIDHKVEGKLLQTDKYLTVLAKSIFKGIDDYISSFELAKSN